MKKQAYPSGFLWGASTAAHQVEGNTHNQWSEWERANAEHMAQTAEKRLCWLPNWAEVKAAAENPDNYISGRGVEHYERYKEDFKLLKRLNMNAFRFSIEWSRIEPEEGKWDEREIAHYHEYLAELKRQGIEPVVTLWHWTEPLWFVQKGAFAKRRNVQYFVRFVEKVAVELGSDFHYVTLLNEPGTYAPKGYALGEWPPESRNPVIAMYVYYNLTVAHNRAYAAMKCLCPQALIGIAQPFTDIQPLHMRSLLNHLTVQLLSYGANWWFVNRTRRYLDFIGLNYYFTSYCDSMCRLRNPKAPVSDLGWYMEPRSIERLLIEIWRRYHKPIIITENGLADARDSQRQWWLDETTGAMERVIAKGVDLRGYLHWSLLDNFEWAFGWWPKFGLVAVDTKTMRRTIRPSANFLADYIKRAQT